MTAEKLLAVLGSVVWCIYSVTTFWAKRLWNWYWTKSRRDQLLETIDQVRLFEEWQAAAIQLDKCMDYDIWRTNSASKHYDWRFVEERFLVLWETEQEGDVIDIVNLIRSGLVRNLGNITAPRLYNRAYGGTKNLIEDYVTGVTRCIKYITEFPTNGNTDPMFTSQMKLDVLHDTRLAFGRTVLVLQGGAIFGLCHLGVVKALHLRGLLPRIISGTATGALIAALVCVHSEMELLDVLSGSGINVEAFASQQNGNGATQSPWYDTLRRRFNRWWKTGHFLDVRVLEKLLKSNIGDITFEEAYQKTKRILNITVTTSGGSGVPNLLNYITAPNVLIWSAALASNATSSSTLYDPVTLYCKNEEDTIVPWGPALQTTFRPWTHAKYRDRASPLHRIGELFNVNHFIVSQARPYLAPFLRSDTHHPNPKQDGRWRLTMPILRLVVSEVQHRLHQLNSLGLLSPSIRRFLLDESVPGTSLTLVPEISPSDFFKLLEHPTKEAIDYWILKGERSVWPAVTALKIRCAIEIEIDRGYQLVRRRRSSHSRHGSLVAREQLQKSGSQGDVRNGVYYDAYAKSEEQQERRRRTRSFGEGVL